jgi:hypothetical protein
LESLGVGRRDADWRRRSRFVETRRDIPEADLVTWLEGDRGLDTGAVDERPVAAAEVGDAPDPVAVLEPRMESGDALVHESESCVGTPTDDHLGTGEVEVLILEDLVADQDVSHGSVQSRIAGAPF